METIIKLDKKIDSPSVKGNTRIHWIDMAKGFCMIAVIAGHLGIVQVNDVVFAFHLTVFFILNGYTMKERPVNRELVQKRFCSYMKPYFITCLFVMAGDVLNNIVLDHVIATDKIFTTLENDVWRSFFASGSVCSFGPVDLPGKIGAIWFLPALFFGTMIVQVILHYIKSDFKRWCAVLAIAFAGAAIGQFIWLPFSILAGMLASAFILLGYYFKQVQIMERLTARAVALCMLIFVAGVWYGYSMINFVTANMDDYFIMSIVGVASSIFIMWLMKKIGSSQLLEFLGRNSLYVLCVHLFGLDVLPRWYDLYLYPLVPQKYAYAGALFAIKVTVIPLVVFMIVQMKNFLNRQSENCVLETRRDRVFSIDIMKAVLIISVVMMYMIKDAMLQNVIYSGCMISFVLLSGSFYHRRSIANQLKKDAYRLLLPYFVFSIGYLAMNAHTWTRFYSRLWHLVLGMSYSKNILQNTKTVGFAYFFLLLFCTRVIYNILVNVLKEVEVHIVAVLVSLVGFFMGVYGWWMPWSLDLAMYMVVFFHVGHLIHQYHVLEKIRENAILYFVFSSLMAFMLYYSKICIADRGYGDYLVVIIGSVSGFFLLYYVCNYLVNARISARIKSAVVLIGQSASCILILYTLFNQKILKYITGILGYHGVYALLISCSIQILSGTVLYIGSLYLQDKGGKLIAFGKCKIMSSRNESSL